MKHDFRTSESCSFCGVDQWDVFEGGASDHCAVREQRAYDAAMAEMRERQQAAWRREGGEGSL